jgi:hypothetical protein
LFFDQLTLLLAVPLVAVICHIIYQYAIDPEMFPVDSLLEGVKSGVDTIVPVVAGIGLPAVLWNLWEPIFCVDEFDGDYYLHIDCNEKCWSTRHTGYTALALALSLLYLPTALALRLSW